MFSRSSSRRLLWAAVASLVAILIFSIGLLATGYQLRQADLREKARAAQSAVARINILLKEAEDASSRASPWLSHPCTSDVRNELNRLTIIFPHLRVLSLLHDDQLTCSSYSASTARTVDLSLYAGKRLSLRQGSVITPASPLLILLTHFGEGTVSASLGATHLTEVLSLLNSQGTLTLRVGADELTPEGTIQGSKSTTHEISATSAQFPYSVEFMESPELTLPEVIDQGRLLVSLFGVISLLTGGLIWRLGFKEPAPYSQLSKAISRGDIIPWYQPVVSAEGDIYGVEVLARWKPANGILIPPDVFIPLAEKSGLIIPLTRLLMEKVVKDLSPVIGRLHQPFHIGFNISAAHLKVREVTVEDFKRFLSFFPDGTVQTIAEITEREPFEQSPALSEFLCDLQNQGIQIALDDFGTGYSNLGYLNTLPIDYIKIDRSFVSRLTEEEGTDKLVECVIGMAQTLNMGIVAEGVETEYQADWLRKHNVTLLQGYYYSRPLPIHEFIRSIVLQKHNFR
ncbi:hypothetical protein VL10_09210 [Leclercia adecarboxylata]|nr:hypothetical protein VL10_09210 [Leclercia adecarboxylata]KMN61726.1 hypothetical protein VK95_22880 [Leclercia sp. LK8]